MKFLVAIIGILALCMGCQKNPETAAATPQTKPQAVPVATPAPGGGNQGIAPMGPNVGPMTPVSGTDSVVGAGGGSVGSAAKDMARRTAAGAGSPAGMGQGSVDTSE